MIPPPDSLPLAEPTRRHWFTSCDETGLRKFGECLVAAVHSGLERTTLVPHLVYDGAPNDFTHYLASIGVTVIFHRLSFGDAIARATPRPGFDKSWAHGTFLRFDIPLLVKDQDFVLYTDTDVVFCRDIPIEPIAAALAGADEYLLDGPAPVLTPHAFNAGVLVLNVKALRNLHPTIVDVTTMDDFANGAQGWYDQGVLNLLFREHRQRLPQAMNWRPFAARDDTPAIVHFHMLKPAEIVALQRGDCSTVDVLGQTLYAGAVRQYAQAMTEYRKHLPRAAVDALRATVPDCRLSEV